MQFIFDIDKYVTMFFQDIHNPIITKLLAFITTLGNLGIIWVVLSILLLFFKETRKAGIMSIVSLLIGAICGEVILKNVFQRPRPFLVYEGINTIIKEPKTYSFPSGHTTSSFTAMLAIYNNVLNKYLKVFVITLAVLMIISRIYFGVHYLSDIVAGILLGIISYVSADKIIKAKTRLD